MNVYDWKINLSLTNFQMVSAFAHIVMTIQNKAGITGRIITVENVLHYTDCESTLAVILTISK